jgi:hypothetical protein
MSRGIPSTSVGAIAAARTATDISSPQASHVWDIQVVPDVFHSLLSHLPYCHAPAGLGIVLANDEEKQKHDPGGDGEHQENIDVSEARKMRLRGSSGFLISTRKVPEPLRINPPDEPSCICTYFDWEEFYLYNALTMVATSKLMP